MKYLSRIPFFVIILYTLLVMSVRSDDSDKSTHNNISFSEANRIKTFGRTFIYSGPPDFENRSCQQLVMNQAEKKISSLCQGNSKK